MRKSTPIKQQEAMARTYRRNLKYIDYSINHDKKEISCGLFHFLLEVLSRLRSFQELKNNTPDINLDEIMLADKDAIFMWGAINRLWIDNPRQPYDINKLVEWLLTISSSVHPSWSEFIKRDLIGIVQISPGEYKWVQSNTREEIQLIAKLWRVAYIKHQQKYIDSLKKASALALTVAQRNSILGV